jgi:hypothetical protein
VPTGTGHAQSVTCVNFSPDGMRLVSSSMDKKLILWDVEAASRLLSISGHADCIYSCQFMPVCGTTVCGGQDEAMLTTLLVVSCRVVSCRVVSCRVVSCRVVSCRVVSCRVVSCAGRNSCGVCLQRSHREDLGRGWCRCPACISSGEACATKVPHEGSSALVVSPVADCDPPVACLSRVSLIHQHAGWSTAPSRHA